jgi:hypothetical protein
LLLFYLLHSQDLEAMTSVPFSDRDWLRVLLEIGLEEDYSEAVIRKWRLLEHDDSPEMIVQAHFEHKLENLEEGELRLHHLLGIGFTEESAG